MLSVWILIRPKFVVSSVECFVCSQTRVSEDRRGGNFEVIHAIGFKDEKTKL